MCRLVKRCNKPDRKEFLKVAKLTALGFLATGVIGFVVKVIFIPINQVSGQSWVGSGDGAQAASSSSQQLPAGLAALAAVDARAGVFASGTYLVKWGRRDHFKSSGGTLPLGAYTHRLGAVGVGAHCCGRGDKKLFRAWTGCNQSAGEGILEVGS